MRVDGAGPVLFRLFSKESTCGFGVRTTLASLDDIIRTTTAHGGKKAEARLPRLHRLLDLAQTIGPDPERFPLSDPRHPSRAGADD